MLDAQMALVHRRIEPTKGSVLEVDTAGIHSLLQAPNSVVVVTENSIMWEIDIKNVPTYATKQ